MHVILINSRDRTLQKRELRDWRELLDRKREIGELIGAEYIGVANKFLNGDTIWVDDAADLKAAQPAFGIDESEPRPGWPFEGNGVLAGRGVSDPRMSIAELSTHIRWFDLEESYVERCRIRGIVPKPPPQPVRWRFHDAAPKVDLVELVHSFAGYARPGVYAERWFDSSKYEWAYKPVYATL
jgi:hypothetical protein